MDIPAELEGILVSTPETLSGAVRFAGTRVFASQLFGYVLSGQTVDQFLEDFDGVTREQVEAVLAYKLRQIEKELSVNAA
jgi:uncharacterized protein (DUF433 family)